MRFGKQLRLIFIFGLLGAFLTACDCEKGSGKLVTERRNIDPFHSIVLDCEANLFLGYNPRSEFSVEAEDNLVGKIQTTVQNGVLTLSSAGCVIQNKPLQFFINLPELQSLEIRKSSKTAGVGLKGNKIRLVQKSDGNCDLELTAQTVELENHGAGTFALKGSAQRQFITQNGSGELELGRMATQSLWFQGSGAGDASLWVTDTLRLQQTGDGRVMYRGKPAVVKNENKGRGQVVSAD